MTATEVCTQWQKLLQVFREHLIVEVTVPGVNEVLSKALEEAQEGYKATLRETQAVMKDAKDDHKAAVRVTCTHNYIHAHGRSCCIIKIIHYQWVL